MELYLIEDYNEIYPELRGAELTDALVKDLLLENGWAKGKIRIVRLSGGKPVLASGDPGAQEGLDAPDTKDAPGAQQDAQHPQAHFSVSHTGRLFGCVIADEPVGLDIQAVTGAKARRLAERYFTEAEIAWIEEEGDFADRFFRLWCRKEAYSKLTGEGLAAVLKGEQVIGRGDLEFNDLVLGDGIYGSICTRAGAGRQTG